MQVFSPTTVDMETKLKVLGIYCHENKLTVKKDKKKQVINFSRGMQKKDFFDKWKRS